MATEEKPRSCFVVAPIGESGSETRRTSDQLFDHVIKPVVEQLGYSAVRADQMTEPGLITPQVMKAVMESDLVVADLSGPNASVFYELSLRHAIGKPVVHLIAEDQRIPFDVRDFRTIQYSTQSWDSLETTKRQLRDHIQAIEKPGYVLVSPISTAVTLDALARQAPQGEGYALLLERVLDELGWARRSLVRLEKTIGTEWDTFEFFAASNPQFDQTLMPALAPLSPRERKVIELRYGLEDGRYRGFDEIGREFNLTSRAIRRIHADALVKLSRTLTPQQLSLLGAANPERAAPWVSMLDAAIKNVVSKREQRLSRPEDVP